MNFLETINGWVPVGEVFCIQPRDTDADGESPGCRWEAVMRSWKEPQPCHENDVKVAAWRSVPAPAGWRLGWLKRDGSWESEPVIAILYDSCGVEYVTTSGPVWKDEAINNRDSMAFLELPGGEYRSLWFDDVITDFRDLPEYAREKWFDRKREK